MHPFTRACAAFLRDDRGFIAIEYALITAGVAAAVAYFFSSSNTDNPLRYFFPA